jgi:hypothetical protein
VTVKRSGREGRWGDLPPPRTRFAAEAAFLILVAAGAAIARVSPLGIIGLMLVAWLLVALIERASSREQARALAGVDDLEGSVMPDAEPATEVEAPAAAPKPRVADRWQFWRRERPRELEAPTAALEERPSRAHVRRVEAEATPPRLGSETIPDEVVATEEAQRRPAVTKRALDLPGLEEPATARVLSAPPSKAKPAEPPAEAPRVEAPPRPPAVEVPAEPPRVGRAALPPPEPPRVPPAPPAPPREWNIWELESRAREQAGDRSRDEEWAALFMFLREHANADGVLPIQFDDLVRESFSELIQAA